jgi:hypothetical protein
VIRTSGGVGGGSRKASPYPDYVKKEIPTTMQVIERERRGKFGTVMLFALMISNSANAWLFGPSNYDECVSKYTKDTESNRAVTIIAYACKYKYNENIKVKYAECIFEHVPGVVSDRAATIVAYACSNKFIENTEIEYADCVLDEVPEVKTDRAATVVAYSCKNRHP